MKSFLLIPTFIFQFYSSSGQINRDYDFNRDWKFHKGNLKSVEKYDFNDSKWRLLDLPHDWSIEDLTVSKTSENRTISGPFDKQSIGDRHSGYTIGGVGWYRKHFIIQEADSGKRIYLNFDGIYMNSTIWINGIQVWTQPYGYTAFWIDISDFVNFGKKENIIAVQVKNTTVASRWYAGSGIYRNVTLRIVDKTHFKPWGIFVSTPTANKESAEISIIAQLKNSTKKKQDLKIRFDIVDAQNKVVASKTISTLIHDKILSTVHSKLQVSSPALWSPDSPNLYKLKAIVKQNDKILDSCNTTFGIRTIEYDSEKGMFLNGENIKLKGGAVHSNNGCLGAAAYTTAEKRRVRLLKEAGYNAVRCAHNPPSAAFLDECDKQGLLVIDEAFDDWIAGPLKDDYKVYFEKWWKHDLGNMILRDRNHPSIFTWSIGNQIRNARDSVAVTKAHELADFVRSIDPTRPITANIAMFIRGNWLDGKAELWKNYDGIFEALDICGYSYQSGQYENVHERLPDRIQFSSEINPKYCFKNWMRTMDNDYVIGNFTWTAMDYMGEAGDGWYGFNRPKPIFPWHTAYVGDMDICGFRKPRSYYRDILFDNGKQFSIFVHSPTPSFTGKNESLWGWDDIKASWSWNGFENDTLKVDVYSKTGIVELFLNNKSLSTKNISRGTEYKASWDVPYKQGTLMAIRNSHTGVSDTCYLKTSGNPYSIKLTPEKDKMIADRQDLCFITVEIVDKNGKLVPYADNMVEFEINGEGQLAGVGNGNPTSLESYQQSYRKAYEGRCLIVIKSTDENGIVEVVAKSKGLKTDNLKLRTYITAAHNK